MNSMTGYSFREFDSQSRTGSIEIKGYNNRYLVVSVNLPGRLSALEPFVREKVSDHALRGRVEVSVRVNETSAPAEVRVDHGLALQYAAALRELAQATGLQGTIAVRDLLQLESVLQVNRDIDFDEYRRFLAPFFDEALAEFSRTRVAEGAALAEAVARHSNVLKALVSSMAENVATLEEHLKRSIRDRFSEVVPGGVDEARLLSETAILLVRYSVQEEIDRLNTHIAAFEETASSRGAVGKKLDFLCQEIGREINTIGSKSVMAVINARVVDAKDALENIREQLRNIE